ncbi:MAG TPA: 2OG-Fe(II) oxygenase [Labilithrix sp.]|nr:2OG-Fe(II) oxygenase [Labilithrix sp.]
MGSRPVVNLTEGRLTSRSPFPRLIQVERIRGQTMQETPFRWCAFEGAIAPFEVASELERTFPSASFESFVRETGAKRHRIASRPLVLDGELVNAKDLSPWWIALARELTSPEYRDAIAELTDVCLDGLALEAALWRHGAGCFIDPHPDNEDKRVTHLLYFSGHGWTSSMGGALRILRSRDIEDVAAEIPPDTGQSVVFVRSDSSWHGYLPIGGHGRDRLALQVIFHRPGLAYSQQRARVLGGDEQ